ncbi:unnamed protein product [Gongylonema pulchrum]|uniref:DDE_Tnp_1_7 domain-containing protein n=1 Tax=Gongylonema pulchrum TaxID=637853 RepID=A0A183EY66_9BILA|nr:unnamed protein product [Gongylonema pulchrum]
MDRRANGAGLQRVSEAEWCQAKTWISAHEPRYNMMKELAVLANLLCVSVVVMKSVDVTGKQRHIFRYNETEAKHLLYLAAAAYTTNPEPCIKK